jgi:phosphoglycolate phosphatase/AHBA synthesis associated protein
VQVRAVLFDMDGVLVDSYWVWFHTINAFAGAHGYPAVTEADFGSCFGQGTDADIVRWFGRHDAATLDAFYDQRFLDHVEHMEVDPEAPGVLAGLRDRGLGTAVVTNTVAPLARAVLGRIGVAADVVCGTGEGAAAKPAPDLVLRACERLGVAPGEACMVGDSVYDRDAARAAGVRFVGYRRAGDARVEALPGVQALVQEVG